MLEIIADSALLRLLMLAGLFGLVAFAGYSIATGVSARHMVRRRLVEDGPQANDRQRARPILRSVHAEGAWFKLVNAIERSVPVAGRHPRRCPARKSSPPAMPRLMRRAFIRSSADADRGAAALRLVFSTRLATARA